MKKQRPSPPTTGADQRRTAHLGSRTIIVFGGDARVSQLEDPARNVLAFPSPSSSGGRSRASATACMQLGESCTLIVLCRWVGHSDYYTLVERAQAAGVRVVRVRGGYTSAQRAINAELSAA
jgi:hypothetical protein